MFCFLKDYGPYICVFQETHLVGSKTLNLRKPWVGYLYHSSYSNFARGVSILVWNSLPFQLFHLELNLEGRYIVIHAIIEKVELVLVGLYIPPLASLWLL